MMEVILALEIINVLEVGLGVLIGLVLFSLVKGIVVGMVKLIKWMMTPEWAKNKLSTSEGGNEV